MFKTSIVPFIKRLSKRQRILAAIFADILLISINIIVIAEMGLLGNSEMISVIWGLSFIFALIIQYFLLVRNYKK
jgi:hypothetical protein